MFPSKKEKKSRRKEQERAEYHDFRLKHRKAKILRWGLIAVGCIVVIILSWYTQGSWKGALLATIIVLSLVTMVSIIIRVKKKRGLTRILAEAQTITEDGRYRENLVDAMRILSRKDADFQKVIQWMKSHKGQLVRAEYRYGGGARHNKVSQWHVSEPIFREGLLWQIPSWEYVDLKLPLKGAGSYRHEAIIDGNKLLYREHFWLIYDQSKDCTYLMSMEGNQDRPTGFELSSENWEPIVCEYEFELLPVSKEAHLDFILNKYAGLK